MPNIYQIHSAIENFAFEVDEETGELLNGEAWDELNLAFEEKVENTACYIKNLHADIAALDAEARILKERAEAKAKKAAQLEKLLAAHLNGEKFESPRCMIGWRKSSSVEVDDISLLPEDLLSVKTSTTANKSAIGKLLKSGQEVCGCRLVEKMTMSVK